MLIGERESHCQKYSENQEIEVTNLASKLLGHNRSFLPTRTPETRINLEFKKYEEAFLELSEHYPSCRGGVRRWLDNKFSTYNHNLIYELYKLPKSKLRYLNVILVSLAHCYRWVSSPPPGNAARQTSLIFPAGIEDLWKEICLLTDQKQVGSNATLFYWCWKLDGKDPDVPFSISELSIDKITSIYTWLGDRYQRELDLWVGVFVVVEAAGTKVMNALLRALDASEKNDMDAVLLCLTDAAMELRNMVRLFGQTIKTKNFSPDVWQKIIQPTYAWGIQSNGERNTGPSGMQIGSLQAINILLGVASVSDIAVLSIKSQKYFTPSQQLFMDILSRKSSIIRRFVRTSRDKNIIDKYNECIRDLVRWRNSHMQRAAMYIEKAGDEVNNSRISTGLTLPATKCRREIFINKMSERIEETRKSLL